MRASVCSYNAVKFATDVEIELRAKPSGPLEIATTGNRSAEIQLMNHPGGGLEARVTLSSEVN